MSVIIVFQYLKSLLPLDMVTIIILLLIDLLKDSLYYRGGLPPRNGTIAFAGTISDPSAFNLSALPTGYLTDIQDVAVIDAVQSGVTCFDNPPLR